MIEFKLTPIEKNGQRVLTTAQHTAQIPKPSIKISRTGSKISTSLKKLFMPISMD